MKEIEAKILNIDKEAIIAKLESMDAKKTYDANMTNHIYRKEGFPGFFRVREQEEKVLTTLKTKTEDSTENIKVLDEREKEVASKEEGEEQAKILGFEHDITLSKHRTEYQIGEVFFAIDEYNDIPVFLEIEGPTEEYIVAWAEKLGYTQSDLRPWGYNKLKKYYEKQES